jgi:two-component system chemotaxis response regulator CheY
MAKVILVADDSPTVRQGIIFILEAAGYKTIEAKDGLEALHKLRGEKVHGFVLDLNMPGIDGITLVRQIRSLPDYRAVPILIVTTESQLRKREEGRFAGVTEWIVKPFRPDQLIQAINRVIREG